jgi:hypothetical protein
MLVVLQITTNMTTLDMPIHFAVKIDWRGREGFSLLEARKENDIFILRNIYHGNVFYNIEDCDRPADPRTDFTCKTKKISGTVEHKITWRHSTKRLRHQNTIYPVIAFTPRTHLPTAKTRTFIPITVRETTPTQPQAPQEAEPTIIYPIKTIPQHAINLLLLGSFLNEEECSITGTPINTQNGAVTTCFHMFEKEAITRWLDQASSNKKCPVCMQPCNVYLLNLDQ